MAQNCFQRWCGDVSKCQLSSKDTQKSAIDSEPLNANHRIRRQVRQWIVQEHTILNHWASCHGLSSTPLQTRLYLLPLQNYGRGLEPDMQRSRNIE